MVLAWQQFQQLITNIVLAVIIFAGTTTIANLFARWLKKNLKKKEMKEFLKDLGYGEQFTDVITSLTKYFIIILGAIASLATLGLGAIFLQWTLALVTIILIISAFFSIREFLPEFFLGIYLAKKGHIKKGYKIRIKELGVEGTVESIELINTVLDVKDKKVIIPNSLIVKNQIIILSKGRKK